MAVYCITHLAALLLAIIWCPSQIAGLQFTIPIFSNNEWEIHDSAIRNLLRPTHLGLSCGHVTPSEAADVFSETLKSYFNNHKEFVKEQLPISFLFSMYFLKHWNRTLIITRNLSKSNPPKAT